MGAPWETGGQPEKKTEALSATRSKDQSQRTDGESGKQSLSHSG